MLLAMAASAAGWEGTSRGVGKHARASDGRGAPRNIEGAQLYLGQRCRSGRGRFRGHEHRDVASHSD